MDPTMSVPSPYSQQRGTVEQKEDCRDYLRTGRCKYGASCKYNHPSNVQSGGGMKAPIDPTEPLFPVRPNEPPCQYYLKHGTCKFGQTCKFNHPPQSTLLASGGPALNGATLVANLARSSDSPQMLWNPAGNEGGVQLLPQRPDEPNCIFFLKNGRCKYGSTCRYHHPLNYHDRRHGDDTRRQHPRTQQDAMQGPTIHYVTSLPSSGYQHGHFVVTDGSVTFVSLDGSPPTQVISVPAHEAYPSPGRPLGLSHDIGSSTSSTSIASSFDTVNSSADPLNAHNDGSSSLWNRPNRSSSGSLNAYNIVDANGQGRTHIIPHGSRTVLIQTNADGSISLPRVASTGSASEGSTIYYDASSGVTRTTSNSQLQSNGSGPATTWRGRRSGSFDHVRSVGSAGHFSQSEIHKSTSVPEGLDEEGHSSNHSSRSPMTRGRPLVSGQRTQRRSTAEVDDGLSMMTSALLTMLDTPEEASGDSYDGYDYDDDERPSQQSTPRMRQQYPSSSKDSRHTLKSEGNLMQYHSGMPYMQSQAYHGEGDTHDKHMLGMMKSGQQDGLSAEYYDKDHSQRMQNQHGLSNDAQYGWSPTWQSQMAHIGRPLQENAQSMSVMPSQSPSNSPHAASNVGLYLP
jgi:hypothetical protein